jgi:RTX calcium-binding nonapeptide repeat (4 copies)
VSHYLKRLYAAPVIAGVITVAAAGTAMALDITGTAGHDRIIGSRGDDTIAGGDGFDVLHAGRGTDSLSGGLGNDRLFASGPHETNVDTVAGDEGDDRIRVRDGARDVVTCGPGIDRVRADQMDSVAGDCESVRPR